MDIKKLSDQVLWDLTKSKVQAERNLTLEIIDLLREIRSRRLHLKHKYSSFHEFCVKELKYDDGTAHRRIKALNLVSQIPEVIQSIESGALSLTTASQVQNFFEQEAKKDKAYTREAKIEILTSLESKSKREIEKTLKTLAPETIRQSEKINYISETHLKLEIVIEEKLLKKIERLKELTSHKNATVRDLIESLVDQELIKKDPELKQKMLEFKKQAFPGKLGQGSQDCKDCQDEIQERAEVNPSSGSGASLSSSPNSNPPPSSSSFLSASQRQRSRCIPVNVRRQVWILAKSQCTFTEPISGQRCEGRRFLQVEHKIPFALGGTSEIQNLTLLCSSHNKLRAIEVFGEEKMTCFV